MHSAVRIVRTTCLLLTCAIGASLSQTGSGSVEGKVIDSSTKKPMEFARVVLFRSNDSSMVTGAVSDATGSFGIERVPFGVYYADVVFLGFEPARVPGIRLNAQSPVADVGAIALTASTLQAAEVVVQGERPSLQYRIDRKVLDAREWSTTASGTAVEVLEQIPSITVDIEGNVSLRGSGSFTVLIDGKPSVLDPQDALQQIPASSIATIEVITNPSAKFDPEGTAGVINIVLSKRRERGLSGTLNANAGAYETYGGDAMINYRADRIETVASFDHNTRSFPGSDHTTTTYFLQDSANGITSLGQTSNRRLFSGLRGSVKMEMWKGGSVGMRGRFSDRQRTNGSSQLYETSTDASIINTHTNRTDRRRGGSSYDLSVDFEQTFGSDKHKMTGDFSYGGNNGDEYTVSELLQSGAVVEGLRTTETGPSDEFEMRLDYERPVGEEGKFETGYQGEIDRDEEQTTLSEFYQPSGEYALLPQFSRTVSSVEQEHALYAVYGDLLGSFGYQLGVRGEATIRNIELKSLGQSFVVNERDFFPTAHFSYRFTDGQQLMASYSRRIDRPRGWELEPFLTWVDASTVRSGNPSLLPEYIDSYEFGAQSFLFGIPLNAEIYYRRTNNRIEGVRSVYAQNVTLHTFANVGRDGSLGLETMATLDPWTWWDLQLIGNLYQYEIDATLLGQPVHRTSTQWSARGNSMFRVTGSTRVQFNVRFNSARLSAQEREEGYVSADLGLRQSLLQNQLTVTLQVRDVFGSVRREETTTAADFIRREINRRDAPIIVLNLRLNLGGREEEENTRQEEEGGFDVED